MLCDGHAMLVDGGKSSQSDRIYTYLRKNGVDHLDYMVATHPDADHIGGLAGALNYASVDVVLSSVRDDETETFKNFVKYAGRQGLSITVPDAGDVLELGSATVSVLGPTGPAEDDNNQSIVLKVVHGSNSVLLTGDAETEEEQKIMQSGADLSSTVLKIAHHGSKYSTSKAWLSAVQPDIAVISCGGDNEYGHPAEQVLNQLKDMDVTVLRTDLQGDIILCEENGRLSWSVDRGEDADVFVPGILPAAEDTAVKDENTVENTTEKTAENIVEKTAENAAENAKTYILNTHTGKFHYPDCRSVKKMKEANKREFTGSRDEIIAMGYDPCGNCHP
ncbi:MAG: MBL fold metallo-hydrolase [Eubacterium sp.]|nr:MBL fold metallo-hydrolase [Eubacterium sp.]